MNMNEFLIFGISLAMLVQAGAALRCYQCQSNIHNTCQEKWDDKLKVTENYYNLCQLWDAKYCVKVTGMWGGVVGTHRFCSSKDLGDQCQDIWFPDHDRMYRACVYSCSGDGCNSAMSVSSFSVGFLMAIAVMLSFLRHF